MISAFDSTLGSELARFLAPQRRWGWRGVGIAWQQKRLMPSPRLWRRPSHCIASPSTRRWSCHAPLKKNVNLSGPSRPPLVWRPTIDPSRYRSKIELKTSLHPDRRLALNTYHPNGPLVCVRAL